MENLRSEIREYFKGIFENSFDSIVVYNLDGIIIDVNQILLDLFGFKREEVMNKFFKDFLRKEDIIQAMNAIKEIKETGRISKPNIYQITGSDGLIKHLEIYGMPFKQGGAVKAIFAIGHDISDKIAIEQKLKESEEKYRILFDKSSHAIVLFDFDGTVIELNSTIEKIFGYSPKELIGKNYLKLPFFSEGMIDILAKRFQEFKSMESHHSEPTYPRELLIKKKDGTFATVRTITSPIKIGDKDYFQSILQDITEQRKAEQKLKASEKKYRDLFDSSPYSIVLLDLNGIIVDVNLTVMNILGYDRDEAIGIKFLDLPLYEPKFIPLLNDRLKLYARGEKLKSIVLPLKKKNGGSFWVNPNVSLVDIDGVQHIQIIFEDLTAKIETENELKESEKKYRLAYERENFYKDVFAHDTRNILQSILSSIEICKMSIKKNQNINIIEELLDGCKQQVLRGANLVKNVKKFSQLEQSKRPLMKINLVKCINKAIKITQSYSKEKKIKISLKTESENFYTKADDLLIDAFENILLNAIHHNPEKSVEIIIKVFKIMENDLVKIQVEFIDNGPGIPDYKKNVIFKRGNEQDITMSGTGLGLYLVHSIIEEYNAKIWVKDRFPNDHSKGCRFIFQFPQF